MGYARGKWGVEYDPRPRSDGEPSGLLPLALVVFFLVAAVSLGVTLYRRIISSHAERSVESVRAAETEDCTHLAAAAVAAVADKTPAPPPIEVPAVELRPPRVRQLLMRLEEAVRLRDLALELATIEQLRATPQASDLDDALARRQGVINMRLLFERRDPRWVTPVEVRRGDTTQRIAREHGSTRASLLKLNPGLDRLVAGRKILVMDHPRMTLAVRRLSHTADLTLNGRFFKRYYLTGAVCGAPGAAVVGDGLRPLLAARGVTLRPKDAEELEDLLPRGATVTVSDI